MTDGRSTRVRRPDTGRGRWTSFVAARPRALSEQDNPEHRVRVEHDNHTLLVHVSDEQGRGWTTIALDRGSRDWAVAQRDIQIDAATAAVRALYEE